MIAGQDLWALVEARAAATPDALFAVDEAERSLSFAQYRDACLRAAAGLAARGASEGAVVSWILPTRLEALVLTGALARLGAVQNPILPIYREREIGFLARQAQPRLLLHPGVWRGFDYGTLAKVAAEAAPGLETVAADPALPEDDPATLPPVPGHGSSARRDAPVRWLLYTSGTTADPKGALHTDASVAAFARGMAHALALAADDRVALVFPVTHVGGIGWLFAGLMAGCAHIVIERFDPEQTPAVLARHRVTQATAGTVFHQAYLAAQRKRGGSSIFPCVRAFPGGGAPKPPALHHALAAEIGGAGVVSGYGMTECPILAMNRVGDAHEKLAHTEGRPCPAQVEIRVVCPDGARAAAGEEGEFRVRGPQLFRGYLDPALDAEAFDADGFFRTGDLGHLDPDGYVVVTGRLKDVIIRKGENVSAREVEDHLHEHPAVAEAAVIGLPDPERGECVCAVVACLEDAEPLGLEPMRAFLRERGLMLQKIPEQLELVPALPRNPTGKVLKHELRARLVSGQLG